MKNKTMVMTSAVLGLSIAVLGLSAASRVWAGKDDACHTAPGMKADARVDHMAKKLKLSDEQKAKVSEILSAKSSKMDETHQQMMELKEGTNKEIEALLTPEQKEKFAKMTKGGKKDCCGGKECKMKK